MDGSLLMPHEHVRQAVGIVVKFVIDRYYGSAGITEHAVDALGYERFYERLGACDFIFHIQSICLTPPLSADVTAAAYALRALDIWRSRPRGVKASLPWLSSCRLRSSSS